MPRSTTQKRLKTDACEREFDDTTVSGVVRAATRRRLSSRCAR